MPDSCTPGPIFTLAAGPAGATPSTLAALGQPVLYHYDPEFLDLYANATSQLHLAFGGPGDAVILQGESVLGLEAAAASLIGPDDVVLNLVSGVFGQGFGHWARRYAKEVLEVTVPFNAAVSAVQVREALEARPDVRIVSAVHCETPSGTINPIDEIGPVVAEFGALLLVDAVSSFAGMAIDPGAWSAGIIVAGPQKCLGGPPGLSLLYVSQEAWQQMEQNPRAPQGSILSILDWRDADRVDRLFPFTPSVSDVNALDACLRQYLDEGPATVQARHQRVARAARAGGEALGLRLWAAERAICSDTVTSFAVPEGLDESALRLEARRRMGVMLSGGQGELRGKILRFAHMGPSAYP
ncbi:MAG: alanine--glyoxylate aminotransferase family protein, partial [Candidatus Dormiibacterota bacterium]